MAKVLKAVEMTAEDRRKRKRQQQADRRARMRQQQTSAAPPGPNPDPPQAEAASSTHTAAGSSASAGRVGPDGEPSTEAWAELFDREARVTESERAMRAAEAAFIKGQFGDDAIAQYRKLRDEAIRQQNAFHRATTLTGALAAAVPDVGGRFSAITIHAMANGWVIAAASTAAPAFSVPDVGWRSGGDVERPSRHSSEAIGAGSAGSPRPMVVMTADQLADAIRSWAVADQTRHYVR